MYDCAKGLGQRSHLAKFSIGVLILLAFLIVVGNGSCLGNTVDPVNLVDHCLAYLAQIMPLMWLE